MEIVRLLRLYNSLVLSSVKVGWRTEHPKIFSVFTWRHGGHVGVPNNSEKSLLGVWSYYYPKLERHFAIVLYTNMAVSSREWKPRIERRLAIFLGETIKEGGPEGYEDMWISFLCFVSFRLAYHSNFFQIQNIIKAIKKCFLTAIQPSLIFLFQSAGNLFQDPTLCFVQLARAQ